MLSPEKKPKRIRKKSKPSFRILVVPFVIGVLVGQLFVHQNQQIIVTEKVTKVVFVEIEPEEIPVSVPKVISVRSPCSTTSTFKSYMDYRSITNRNSNQYKLQDSSVTDNGYRKYDDRLMIAITNYSVGDYLDIELSTGEVLETVVGDIKANTSCTHPDDSLFEFIVDTKTMDPFVKLMGNFDVVHTGTVINITELESGGV